MTKEAKHTLEWTYEEHELSEGYSAIVYDEHGRGVVDHLREEEAKAIVERHNQSINACEGLDPSAIKDVVEALERIAENAGDITGPRQMAQIARQALSKVRGEGKG